MFGDRPFLCASGRVPLRGAIVVAVVLVAHGLVAPPVRAETADSYRARIEQIEKEIAAKGAEVEALGRKVSAADAELTAVRKQIRHDERLLADDDQATREASALVRQVAAVAYVGRGTGGGSAMSVFDDTSSIRQSLSDQHYLESVNAHWDDAITQLELAKGRAEDDRARLLQRQRAEQQVVDSLHQSQADVTAAISEQRATLQRVQSELATFLVVQKRQAKAQARQEAKQALAAAFAGAMADEDAAPTDPLPQNQVTRPDPPPSASPPPKPVTGTGYANPLRAVSGLSPQRIDSGVDYAGVGPVYAMGNGVVLNVYANDWPGGVFIAYRLSDGPARGLVVFTAEDLNPQVSVGSTVTANTVIGDMYGGPHGIEIGWADGSRIPNAMARSYGQYHGGNSTAFGYNFSRLLQALGAPGGILQNDPTGSLPDGWPEW